MDWHEALDQAVTAAREAGARLRAERQRPGGLRATSSSKAPIDIELERFLHERLAQRWPTWGWRAEELPALERAPQDDAPTWLVDPHDGTSAAIAGWRGSTVSIGLVHRGLPVLGVIFAPAAPDDAGDLFCWAEGCGPLRRNGEAVDRALFAAALGASHTVLVSQHADRIPPQNGQLVAPARYRPIPGIAYRLALCAAGEGEAAVSLFGPSDYDLAGGHALLRAVGGEIYDQRGQEIRYHGYSGSGAAYVFAGAPAIARALVPLDWDGLLRSPRAALPRYAPVCPARELIETDGGRLARAQGAWLGQLAGDALGSLVEFQSAASIAERYPRGVRALADGGTFDTIAGQPTDDSEMALMLARTLVERRAWDAEAVASAYVHWLSSKPFDLGGTTSQALTPGLSADAGQLAATLRRSASLTSQANGALMRVSPLGIFSHALPLDVTLKQARADAALTHPHAVCQDASALFVATIAHAIATGADARASYDFALELSAHLHPDVAESVTAAADAPPRDFQHQQGWVRTALQNAFFRLLHSPDLEDAVVQTVMSGGDTDTNGAIAGALAGAIHGRAAVPPQWQERVLTCRPQRGLAHVRRPRPMSFWPVDALLLPEHLLVAGREAARG